MNADNIFPFHRAVLEALGLGLISRDHARDLLNPYLQEAREEIDREIPDPFKPPPHQQVPPTHPYDATDATPND